MLPSVSLLLVWLVKSDRPYAPKRLPVLSQTYATEARIYFGAPQSGRQGAQMSILCRHALWRKPIDLPETVGLLCVAKPVVQTIWAPLPKFKQLGFDDVTAPVWR